MEKVINLLYDIEEKANRIISRTDEQKKAKRKEIDEALAMFEKSLNEDTNKKVQAIQNNANNELEKEKKALLESFAAQEQQLNDRFNKKHDAFVEHVFSNIIGA